MRVRLISLTIVIVDARFRDQFTHTSRTPSTIRSDNEPEVDDDALEVEFGNETTATPDAFQHRGQTKSEYAIVDPIPNVVFKVEPEPEPSITEPSDDQTLATATPGAESTVKSKADTEMTWSPPPPRPLSPANDHFFPRVKPPYLPATAEDGSVVRHSCRPGGPRLYDLLGLLSLKPYGLQAWSVIDHEEEIFETDDKRDEDAVMCALWNRWVFLHRIDFNINPYQCIFDFMVSNSKLIHDWAGLLAFNIFLMDMRQCHFLTTAQVAKVLTGYYNSLDLDPNALRRSA